MESTKEMAKRVSDSKRREHEIMLDVFNNDKGRTALCLILNRLGYFATDATTIKPELIATANWLLQDIGVITQDNLGHYMRAMLDTVHKEVTA